MRKIGLRAGSTSGIDCLDASNYYLSTIVAASSLDPDYPGVAEKLRQRRTEELSS